VPSPSYWVKKAETARRLIDKNGRAITIVKLSQALDDNAKPWRGEAAPRTTPEDSVDAIGVFVPLSSQQILGIQASPDLDVTRGQQICLVAANNSAGDLTLHNEILDGGTRWRIVRAQLLQPGSTALLYAFEVKQ